MTKSIKIRSGTTLDWSLANPVLAPYEVGYATDAPFYLKEGNGTDPWSKLNYARGPSTTKKFKGNIASQAGMLALVDTNIGDLCTRADLSGQVFELTALPASVLANWSALNDMASNTVLATALGTSNVSSFATLTDATTAAIPTTNTPLANALAAKAPLASPALTGTPTVPTAAPGTNTTQAASTAFVVAAVNGVINAAPGALDTLNELAAALGNDASFSTTVTNSLAAKADKDVVWTIVAGTTYLASSSDRGLNLLFTNASGCLVTIPVSLASGWNFNWMQDPAAGTITFQGDGTSAVVSLDNVLTSAGPKSVGSVFRSAANTYIVAGQLGSLTSSSITNFQEAVEDIVGSMFNAAGGVYTDGPSTGGGGSVTFPAGLGGTFSDFSRGGQTFGLYPQNLGNTTISGFMTSNTGPNGTAAPTIAYPGTSLGGLGYWHRLKWTGASATDYIKWEPGGVIGYIPDVNPAEPTVRIRTVFSMTDAQAWGTNGARNFMGIHYNTGASLSNTLTPSTYFTNCIGVYSDHTDQYLRFIVNGATAGSAYLGASLGAGFEANPAPASDAVAPVYDLQITLVPGAGDNRIATAYIYNRVANVVAFIKATATGGGSTTAVGATKMPVAGSQVSPLLYRCNNGATTPVAPVLQATGLFGGALTGMA